MSQNKDVLHRVGNQRLVQLKNAISSNFDYLGAGKGVVPKKRYAKFGVFPCV
jgi:hypothetical protein